jgi:hypothetical protein
MGRRDERIVQAVANIEQATNQAVLALVVQADDGTVSVITPDATALAVLRTMAKIDWRTAILNTELTQGRDN